MRVGSDEPTEKPKGCTFVVVMFVPVVVVHVVVVPVVVLLVVDLAALPILVSHDQTSPPYATHSCASASGR